MRKDVPEFGGDREEQGDLRVGLAGELPMRRVIPEARALDLPAEVGDNYLYTNA